MTRYRVHCWNVQGKSEEDSGRLGDTGTHRHSSYSKRSVLEGNLIRVNPRENGISPAAYEAKTVAAVDTGDTLVILPGCKISIIIEGRE